MKDYTRVVVLGHRDEFGRYEHVRCWMDDYFPGHPEGEHVRRERGQVFFSELPDTDAPQIDMRGASDAEIKALFDV